MFYRGFSTILAPMTRLTQKEVPFQCLKECEWSFGKLKEFITLASIFALPADASGVGVGCVLMQQSCLITYALM